MSTGGALSTCLFLFITKHCILFYVKGKRSGKRALNLLVLVVILSTNFCQLFVYIFQLLVYKNQLIFSCLFTKVSCLSERHLVVKLCTKSFSYLFGSPGLVWTTGRVKSCSVGKQRPPEQVMQWLELARLNVKSYTDTSNF